MGIEGARAAEADVTRTLYERYGDQIFRYCLHQLGSREEAEDAVQSTFLNAFRGIGRGIVPELESAWLFKIAHNVCLSRRRSSWRRGRIESPADFDVVEELVPAPSRRADELIGLQDVLEQMPESQRRAILLREWQGLSYREIGEELELSQAAVETLIFRARRTLAAGLEQPPEPGRRKLARGTDLGNVLAGLKSLLLGGSAAAKVAATVVVVGAGTVAATAPAVHHRALPHGPAASHASLRAAPTPTVFVRYTPARTAPVTASSAVRSTVQPRLARRAGSRHVKRSGAVGPPPAAAPAPADASEAATTQPPSVQAAEPQQHEESKGERTQPAAQATAAAAPKDTRRSEAADDEGSPPAPREQPTNAKHQDESQATVSKGHDAKSSEPGATSAPAAADPPATTTVEQLDEAADGAKRDSAKAPKP